MHDGQTHHLLAQIPLTVSPFVSLPTATTLPYTYKSLPSTLPPSSTGDLNGSEKPKYVVSSTGHAAHPDEIIASCRALQAHLQQLQDDAERTLREWDERIKERDLAEKRRLAPGWLDREEKILEPERKDGGGGAHDGHGAQPPADLMSVDSIAPASREDGTDRAGTTTGGEGEELDRAFGGLDIR
ncbi:MAG: hypothetical protein M1819_005730 [Sarea resinae]|nr:MAG: hypothetical protein M1819_005730 [Sarea resinae]